MAMAPVQFAAHQRAARSLDRPRGMVMELMIAQLTAIVANTGFRGFAEPKDASAFLVTRGAKPKKRRSQKVQRQQLADSLRAMFEERIAREKKQS